MWTRACCGETVLFNILGLGVGTIKLELLAVGGVTGFRGPAQSLVLGKAMFWD